MIELFSFVRNEVYLYTVIVVPHSEWKHKLQFREEYSDVR